MNESAVRKKYEQITNLLIRRNLTITTMESCTAGQIISLITDTEGSSAAVHGAFVTYCNSAKIQQGVPAEVIDQYGVYSKETACAMAEACRRACPSDIGIGITGTFGNTDPDNEDSVPGEIYFAVSTDKGTCACFCSVPAQVSRYAYKLYAADAVAEKLLEVLHIE